MLNSFHPDRIFIACGYTDLRRGIDGLATIVQEQFKLDPFTNTLFLFYVRRCDRIKGLFWDGDGFVLLYKRPGNGNNVTVIETPRPQQVIPGSFASAEAIAHIMTQKYVIGSPLYRQEQEFHRQGLELSRRTMANWLVTSAEKLLTPLYECLHKKLLQREILHADETTLQVLHEERRKPQSQSYM